MSVRLDGGFALAAWSVDSGASAAACSSTGHCPGQQGRQQGEEGQEGSSNSSGGRRGRGGRGGEGGGVDAVVRRGLVRWLGRRACWMLLACAAHAVWTLLPPLSHAADRLCVSCCHTPAAVAAAVETCTVSNSAPWLWPKICTQVCAFVPSYAVLSAVLCPLLSCLLCVCFVFCALVCRPVCVFLPCSMRALHPLRRRRRRQQLHQQ